MAGSQALKTDGAPLRMEAARAFQTEQPGQRVGGGGRQCKETPVAGWLTQRDSREDGGRGEGGRAWVPGGEVMGFLFQGPRGLLAAGGAAAGRDGAAIRLLPAPGAAAVPRGEAGYPGEGAPGGRWEVQGP